MYSFDAENLWINSRVDNKIKESLYLEIAENKKVHTIINTEELISFLAALDKYVVENPNNLETVINILDEELNAVKELMLPYEPLKTVCELAQDAYYLKKLQYINTKAGNEYDANIASLNTIEVLLGYALDTDYCHVCEIEHNMKVISILKEIERETVKEKNDPLYQSKIGELTELLEKEKVKSIHK